MYQRKLARIYDVIYHFKDYGKDSNYILETIRSHHPAARSLLETACGTGRFLELLRDQFEVEGLDLSDDMLAEAAVRLPGIALHSGDMCDFSLPRKYDVVCCLFRSIAFVRTADRFTAAIGSMANHLTPGGILLIEPFFTPKSFWDHTITMNEYHSETLKIAWMYTSDRRDDLALLANQFLVGTPDGIEHFSELHEMGLFSEALYRDAFAAAGLALTHDPQGPTGTGLYIGRAPAAE